MDHTEHLNNYKICNDKPGTTDPIINGYTVPASILY
jgi:hypothetical protein